MVSSGSTTQDMNAPTEISSQEQEEKGTMDNDQSYVEEEDDSRKIFLSRIANDFNKDSIIRIFEKEFGKNCIEEVALSVKHDNDEEKKEEENANNDFNNGNGKRKGKEEVNHRGFGFVTMSSIEKRNEAVEKGTVRGKAKELSKRKHTMYIRPIVRQQDEGTCVQVETETGDDNSNNNHHQNEANICYLWMNFRCPYGEDCKFEHKGEGGCIDTKGTNDPAKKMKKQKCFSYKKTGKCKLGDKCPYNHEFEVKVKPKLEENEKKDSKDIDCINWKTKGKCRKGDKCPYRHDDSVRQAFLAKKEKKKDKKKKRGRNDNAQPLSIRVFGLNYDSKEEDVREFFKDCGTIKEITFPTFEDSGRSKGYCGILFTSPKATAKATELDGSSLHDRWLSVQAGKMYLKQWEEMEKERANSKKGDEVTLGEFGQKIKKRKKHGFKNE